MMCKSKSWQVTDEFSWKLASPGNGNAPGRESPIAAWAGRQFAFWLAVRSQQQIVGNPVFPSTRAGKAWSDTACYRACKAVLAPAGMDPDAGSVFKLRHEHVRVNMAIPGAAAHLRRVATGERGKVIKDDQLPPNQRSGKVGRVLSGSSGEDLLQGGKRGSQRSRG
jgi:hypothetical protein